MSVFFTDFFEVEDESKGDKGWKNHHPYRHIYFSNSFLVDNLDNGIINKQCSWKPYDSSFCQSSDSLYLSMSIIVDLIVWWFTSFENIEIEEWNKKIKERIKSTRKHRKTSCEQSGNSLEEHKYHSDHIGGENGFFYRREWHNFFVSKIIFYKSDLFHAMMDFPFSRTSGIYESSIGGHHTRKIRSVP